jgi:hypothetical protein
MKFLKTIFNQFMDGVSTDATASLTQDEIITNVKNVSYALELEDNDNLRILLADPQVIGSLKSFIPEQKHDHIRWMEQALLYASGCLTRDDGVFSRFSYQNIREPNELACKLLVEVGANPHGRVIGDSWNDNASFYDIVMKHANLPHAMMYKHGEMYRHLAHSLDKQKDDMVFNRILSAVGLKPING